MTGGWRLSLHLAAREVRRRPGRTALVMAAVGLPVAGLMTTLIVVRTATETPEEARAAVYGQADAVAAVGLEAYDTYSAIGLNPAADRNGATAALAAALPDGSRVATVLSTSDGAVRPDGHLRLVPLSDEDLDDPLLAGRYEVLSGRAPRRAGEAAVPTDVAAALGLSVGDDLDLLSRGTVRVTGIVAAADRSDGGRPIVMGGDLAPNPVPSGDTAARGSIRWFVDLPGGPATLQALPPLPAGAWWPPFEATDLAADQRTQVAAAYAVTGVVLIVTGMIAVAAFAVGARRQLRAFGILAAGGVPPAGLRRIGVLQGLVTGLVASVAGVGSALAVAVIVIAPRLDGWIDRAVGPLEVSPLDLAAVVVLGTAATTVAAWVPARTAARVPVLASLSGRRPQGRVPAAVPVAGAALAAVGAAAVALSHVAGAWSDEPWGLAVAGAAAVLLGGALMTPWVVTGLEPLAGRLRGAARLAARDLARQRVRTGAAAAAVLAPVAVAVFALTVASARDGAHVQYLRTDQVVASEASGSGPIPIADEARAAVRAVLPGAVEADLRVVTMATAVGEVALDVTWGGEPGDTVVDDAAYSSLAVATPELLDALAAPAGVADIVADDDTVVALAPVSDDIAAMDVTPAAPGVSAVDGVDLVSREDVRVVATDGAEHLPRLVVSEGWAQRRGLTVGDRGVVWRAPAPLTDRQRSDLSPDRTAAEQDALVRQTVLGEPAPPARPWLRFERPSPADHGLAGAAAGGILLFALAVVAVTIALTRAEARDDTALLLAVGVPPATQRGIAAWQAALLPAVGVAIGVPLGLACAWAALVVDPGWEATGGLVAVPWVALGLVVAVPLVSGAVTRAVASFAWRRPHATRPRLGWD